MKRVLAGLVSLALLLGVVVGGFLGLVRWGRLNALTEIDWANLFSVPDDGRLLVGVLTLIGWGAWLAVVASVIAELLNALSSSKPHIRLPGLGWLQPAVAVLIGAILGMSVALGHPTGTVQVAPVPHSAPTLTSPRAPAEVAKPSATPEQAPAPPLVATEQGVVTNGASSKGAVSHPAVDHYQVQPGDDLWTLAEQLYGDGSQWRLIATANPGIDIQQPLTPGSVLALPILAPAHQLPGDQMPNDQVPSDQPTDPNRPTVVVRAGDTLSGLALTHLRDANRWPEIYRLNTAVITDPDLIDIGWVLTLPEPSLAESPSQTPPSGPTSEAPTPSTAPSQDPTPPAAPTHQDPAPTHQAPASPVDLPSTSSASPPSSPDAASPAPTAASASGVPVVFEQVSPATDPARVITGGLCGLSAVAIIGGLAMRRRVQLTQRPVGRAVPTPSAGAIEFRTAAGRLTEQVPTEVADMAAAPMDDEPTDDKPSVRSPGQLEVIVGQRGEQPLMVDLAQHPLISINAECPEPAHRSAELMAGMAVSLLTSPWSADVQVIASGLEWLTALDDVNVRTASTDEAIEAIRAELGVRRQAAADVIDPQWEPWVVLITESIPGDHRDVVISACEAQVGIAAVVVDVHPVPWITHGESITITTEQSATLSVSDPFVPQLVNPSSQQALAELYRHATTEETVSASWWHEADPPVPVLNPQPVTVREVEPMLTEHPVLKVLGPVELTGARGPLPSRAIKQCEEYCAWLLQHPGSSARHMTQSLLVAETTRRSNMSRLRTWLGSDDAGNPYLPEAFTGRIELAPGVSCDWERVQALIGPGVNHSSDQALADALSLVNGAPLADAAPGQWAWAEEWRIEMSSTVRDMAVELADRALAGGDLETARWAAGRGLSTSPGDELLTGRRIRTEHLAGNQAEVERLVLFMTRHARAVGIDLLDETVVLLQEVMEGRPRQRRA